MSETMDLADLVAIDLDAELKKVAGAALQGAWQIPAECCRLAFSLGAKKVEAHFFGRRMEIRWQGPALDQKARQQALVLLDKSASPDSRHHALVALEASGHLALIGLAGARPTRVEIADHRLAAEVPNLEVKRARAWLLAVSQHLHLSDRQLLVQRKMAPAASALGPHGVVDESAQLVVGRIWASPDDDQGHITIIAHGLVLTHVSVSEGPFFDAVLEVSPKAKDPTPTPEAARAVVEKTLPRLKVQFQMLLEEALEKGGALDEAVRVHMARAALQDVAAHGAFGQIFRIPFLPSVFRPLAEGRPRWRMVSLQELKSLAAKNDGVLPALDPTDRPQAHVLGPSPTPVLAEADRALIAEILQVQMPTPPRRKTAFTLGAAVRRARHGASQFFKRLFHPWQGRALGQADLSQEERRLLDALSQLHDEGAGGIVMALGKGPVRKKRSGQVLLPRDNGLVIQAVRLYAEDPNWLYPVAVTLCGRGPSSRAALEAARKAWHQRPVS
jgi:hypothetical protein